MKTKLQLFLLLILFSNISLSEFDVEEFKKAGSYHPTESKTPDEKKHGWNEVEVNLICEFIGTSNGKPINRIAEIRVQDYTNDNKDCSFFTTGLFYPLERKYYPGGYTTSETKAYSCTLTDSFIILDGSSKYDWATQSIIKIHKYTGKSSANRYIKTSNVDIQLTGFCKEFDKKSAIDPTAIPNKTPSKDRGYSSGTGFYVNKKGMMITNNHVVKSCSKIKVDGSNAVVKSFDATNDLALLQVDSSTSLVPNFRSGKGIRLGDGVTVAGYPLRSVLGSGLNVVTGSVASLSGIKNDSSKLQITAPVNSGNSGGPMFDSSGLVVGVIVSKINNTKAKEILGEEIQGANFAIKGSVVKSFLDTNDVNYKVSSSNKNISTADIAEAAKEYTSLIKCWK